MKLKTWDKVFVIIASAIIVSTMSLWIGFEIGTHTPQADLEAEYEQGRLLGFAQGADEAIVILDAKFVQGGRFVESWRNCLRESFSDDPTIGKWVNSLETFDSTDTMPAVEYDSLDEVEP